MSAIVKCLLVDDREENLLVLSELLKQDGLEILQARSGAEALEILLLHDVALAFLDVQMPEMDGFELAELMRGSARTRHVPIIFVTAGPRDQHRLFKGYETGAVDFLYKPVEPHILRNKADVFFQLHRQRQEIDRQLHERTETLRVNEMFTALLAHDLRNPLNAILTSALLVQRMAAEPAIRDAATRIQSSGKRMSGMIEDILDMARARIGGGIVIEREVADFGGLIERAVREHQASSPERRIEMVRKGTLSGEWDPGRITQVASNLIGNALKHGAAHGEVRVEVDGSQDSAVTFSVANEGVIPAELHAGLFDPFHGGPRRAGRNAGLGLGLYIVQQIVAAHSGTVEVVSSPETQTTFNVRMPRH